MFSAARSASVRCTRHCPCGRRNGPQRFAEATPSVAVRSAGLFDEAGEIRPKAFADEVSEGRGEALHRIPLRSRLSNYSANSLMADAELGGQLPQRAIGGRLNDRISFVGTKFARTRQMVGVSP